MHKHLWVGLAVVVLGVGVVCANGSGLLCAGGAAAAAATEPTAYDAELERNMDALDGAMRKLRPKLGEAKLDVAACLGFVNEIQTRIIASKKSVPSKSAKLAADEKAKAVAGFRKLLNDLLRASLELEEAVLDGNAEAANAAFQKMNGAKKTGHDTYKK